MQILYVFSHETVHDHHSLLLFVRHRRTVPYPQSELTLDGKVGYCKQSFVFSREYLVHCIGFQSICLAELDNSFGSLLPLAYPNDTSIVLQAFP